MTAIHSQRVDRSDREKVEYLKYRLKNGPHYEAPASGIAAELELRPLSRQAAICSARSAVSGKAGVLSSTPKHQGDPASAGKENGKLPRSSDPRQDR